MAVSGSSCPLLPVALLLLLLLHACAGDLCYNDIGCFTDDSVGGAPWKRESVNTSIMRYTRDAPNTPILVYGHSAIQHVRVKEGPSAVIIHGLNAHSGVHWIRDMKSALFQETNIENVYVVDWSDGAKLSILHFKAPWANTRMVGAELAYFLEHLWKTNPNTSVHVIGHSLGAQTAGFAGKICKKKGHAIDRITGLDAALMDLNPFSLDEIYHLAAGDAQFVEAIHTSRLGMVKDIGDVDFYVNGLVQPGCVMTRDADAVLDWDSIAQLAASMEHDGAQAPFIVFDLIKMIWKFLNNKIVKCSHAKSTEYYIESLTTKNCKYWGPQEYVDPCNAASGKLGATLPTACSRGKCSAIGYNTPLLPGRGSVIVDTTKDCKLPRNDVPTMELKVGPKKCQGNVVTAANMPLYLEPANGL